MNGWVSPWEMNHLGIRLLPIWEPFWILMRSLFTLPTPRANMIFWYKICLQHIWGYLFTMQLCEAPFAIFEFHDHHDVIILFKTSRHEQDSNLRGKIPLDFKSNALTTRPSWPDISEMRAMCECTSQRRGHICSQFHINTWLKCLICSTLSYMTYSCGGIAQW